MSRKRGAKTVNDEIGDSNARKIANSPAFWNQMSEVEKATVREKLTFEEQKRDHVCDMSAATLNVWADVEARYLVAVGKRSHFGGYLQNPPAPAVDSGPEIFIPAAKALLLPQIGLSDENIFEVNYDDEIQVQIDRTEDGKVRLVVWKIGDDRPLDEFTAYLPELRDCFNCGNRHGFDGLDDNRYCSECTRPYDAEEIEYMRNFAEGFIKAKGDAYLDEWVALPNEPSLDIHFQRLANIEHTKSDKKISAWGYRRDKHYPGSCEDELRLF